VPDIEGVDDIDGVTVGEAGSVAVWVAVGAELAFKL
jgi:hypothetical protein